MNEIVLKRKLSESVREIVKNRNPDVRAVAATIDALGSLLSLWTGENVRVQITAEGQNENLDLTKGGTSIGLMD